MSFSRQFHCHDRRLAVPGGYSPTRTVEGPFLRCAMRLLSLAFSFGWTEVAKRLQAGAKAEHSFTSLDFCSFIYFFSFPRRDSPSIISFPLSSRFSGCPMLLAQCPSPYLPTSPLLVSRVLSFSSFLSFHFSTCCFLICLTSHASRPPFSLFLSAVLCIPVPRTIENCASSMKDSTAYSWRFLSPSF